MSSALNLADLTKTAGNKKQAIKVLTPEIKQGSFVYVYCPGTDDRDLFDMQYSNYRKSHGLEGNVGLRKFVVAWMLADEENQRLVCSGTEENRVKPDFITAMNELAELPMPVANRVFDKARTALGLIGDTEELKKNSKTTPTDAGSGSKPKAKASAAKPGSANSKTPKS